MNDLSNLFLYDKDKDDLYLRAEGPNGEYFSIFGSLEINSTDKSVSGISPHTIKYPDGSSFSFSASDLNSYLQSINIDPTTKKDGDATWTKIYTTDNKDIINLSGLKNVADLGVLELAVKVSQGNDVITFPEVSTSSHRYPWSLGTLDSSSDFADQYYAADPNFDRTGFQYRFVGDKVTVTSKNSNWSGTTVADNVYKIMDSHVSDDVFIGNGGTQAFRSDGGFDTMTGGAGADYFRIDGSQGFYDLPVYNAIGHQIYITDYKYDDIIRVEDFGVTDAGDINVYTENGYTYVDVTATYNGQDSLREKIIKVKGEFETGAVTRNTWTTNKGEGFDYSIEFFDPRAKFIGNNDEDRFELAGDLWRPDLDARWFGNPTGYTFDGKGGRDVFSGGAGSDHYIGGDHDRDQVNFYDSQFGIVVSEQALGYTGSDYQKNISISDGFGLGGVDTIAGIERIFGSHHDDVYNLPNNSRENGLERINPLYGNDTINAPGAALGYWDIVDSPDDPRIITPAPDGFAGDGSENDTAISGYIRFDASAGKVYKIIDFADDHVYGTGKKEFTDTVIGIRGISGSEGNDIFNVTLNDSSQVDKWAFGGIGNDIIEDFGSSYDYLMGDDGDDTLISGGYVDTLWGDWRDNSNYVSTGDDTFVAVGQGYSNIKDYESGENVWWLTKDGSYIPGSKDDVVVTHDYGSKSTKIGYETADGNIVNRIEISGLMKIDSFTLSSYSNATENSLVMSSSHQGANITFVEDSSIGVKDQDGNLITAYERSDLGTGTDTFYGDSTADLVTTAGGADYIQAFGGDDYIVVSGLVGTGDKNPFDGRSNYALVDTGTGSDIVEITTDFDGAVKLISGGGDDKLVLSGDANFYEWSTVGNDLILKNSDATITLQNQLITDGSKNIFSYIEFVSADPITGQEKTELYKTDPNAPDVNNAVQITLGTAGNDELWSKWDALPQSIIGFTGNDTLEGGYSSDLINGGAGNDLIFGDSGSDRLNGGDGEDTLVGDAGSDALVGGSGDDVYKIDFSYNGFLDVAGKDNVLLDANGNIDLVNSKEVPWDIVVGNVDTINDSEGNDRIWVTNFQPTLNPFDQYRDAVHIDGDGNFVFKWGWDEKSSTSYQHTLLEDYEHQIFDPTVKLALAKGGYIATKNNVNSKTEVTEYTYPLFDEKWQAEHFLRQENVDNGGNWNDPIPSLVSVNIDPAKIVNVDANGFGTYGAALSNTKAKTLEFWAPQNFTKGATKPTDEVELTQTLWFDKIDNKYEQGGNLDALFETGEHTTFDLGRLETWPGFEKLPIHTGTGVPVSGTQEYYLANFVLGDETTYPPTSDLPFVEVIKNKLVSLKELDSIADGTWDPTNPDNEINSIAEIKNVGAKLEQGFIIEGFTDKHNGVWNNTVESIVFTSPTSEYEFVDKYGKDIVDGKTSGHDAVTKHLAAGKGTEYFLSPSGVVDFGSVPTRFDANGNPIAFKNQWDGAATSKNFFLIANTETAGQNDFGLGFNGNTSQPTDQGDRSPAASLYLGTNEVLTSGAAKHDIIVGHDGSQFTDFMFGHGGDDALSALGGDNYVIGGSGADNFIIEAVTQKSVLYGDHVKMDATDNSKFEKVTDATGREIYTSQNESYADQVFFDFAMPKLVSNPNFDAALPISSSNKPLISDSDSFIKPIDIATNHFHVYHDFGDGRVVDVELYDIENAWFSDGAGGMELKPLTEGRPITKDDFGNLTYGRGEVKFWVEYDDVSSKNDGSGSTWGGGTTISVVTTRVKTVTDPTTKERITYEDPTVHWKGLASEAESFVFSDATINVINVTQTDITGQVHDDLTVYGTNQIDLIIGDDHDNLIFGGDHNDIIFGGGGKDTIYGEGGSDVIIGGDMDDILYGDYAHDATYPEIETDTRGNILNPEELDGDDVIVGGQGDDEIVSGEGSNVVASGDLSSVILNTELDSMHTFIDYDEDDLPV